MVSRRDVAAIAGSTLFGFAATASAKPEDYVSRRFKPAGSLPTSSTRRLTRELPARPRCTRPRRATSPAQLHVAASEPCPGASQYGGRTTKKDKERLQLPTSGKEKAEPLNAPPKPKGEEKKGEEKKEEAPAA